MLHRCFDTELRKMARVSSMSSKVVPGGLAAITLHESQTHELVGPTPVTSECREPCATPFGLEEGQHFRILAQRVPRAGMRTVSRYITRLTVSVA